MRSYRMSIGAHFRYGSCSYHSQSFEIDALVLWSAWDSWGTIPKQLALYALRLVAIAGPATRRLVVLDSAESLKDLSALRSNRLETLSGDRRGQHSIRINRQWRICFRWEEDGPYDVEIVDYHR